MFRYQIFVSELFIEGWIIAWVKSVFRPKVSVENDLHFLISR